MRTPARVSPLQEIGDRLQCLPKYPGLGILLRFLAEVLKCRPRIICENTDFHEKFMGLKIGADAGQPKTTEDPPDLARLCGRNGGRRKTIKHMRRLPRLVLAVTVVLRDLGGGTGVLGFAVWGRDWGLGLGLGLGLRVRVILSSHKLSETSGR